MPLSELLPLVQASLPDSVQVAGVTISPEADRAYQVSLSQPRRATVGVNQYTGEVLGSTSRTPFFSTVFSLHRWIGGSRDSIGKTVVGVSTLLMVIVVLTGLLIWIPKSLPSLRNRLSIKLNKGWRRFWFDLHVSGGFYATLLLLVFALTGLTWSFPWYRSAFYGMLGVEMKAPQHGAKPGAHGPQGQGRPEGQGRGEGRGREGQGRPEGRDGEGQGRGFEGQDRGFEGQGRSEGRGFEGQGRGEGRPQPNQYISWQRALDAVIAESGNEQKFTVQDGNISAALGGWGNIRAADTYSFDRRGQITGESGRMDLHAPHGALGRLVLQPPLLHRLPDGGHPPNHRLLSLDQTQLRQTEIIRCCRRDIHKHNQHFHSKGGRIEVSIRPPFLLYSTSYYIP
jgi:hypothetical protein